MFPLLALAHRHLKLIHCLLRAAVLTSTDEFHWQRQLIEFSFPPFFLSSGFEPLFHFPMLVSQLENQFSFQKVLRSYSSQPWPLAHRVQNKLWAPSVGTIYYESSAVILCFSPLKNLWKLVHNNAYSAACESKHNVFRKLIKQNCHESWTKSSSSTKMGSQVLHHHNLHSSVSTPRWRTVNLQHRPWDLNLVVPVSSVSYDPAICKHGHAIVIYLTVKSQPCAVQSNAQYSLGYVCHIYPHKPLQWCFWGEKHYIQYFLSCSMDAICWGTGK